MKRQEKNSRYEEDYQDDYTDSGYEEDCCICITRSFVFWCNVVLLFFGLLAMGYSIYLWVTPDLDWAGDDLALRFTVFAAFLIIIALIGITGTWDEVERCDLIVYLILIVSIVAAQIAFVIYASTNEESIKEYLNGIWDDWSDARKEQAMESYECGLYHADSFNVTGENGVIINQDPRSVANCVNAALALDYCFENCYSAANDAITTIGALTSTFLILFALLEVMLLISSFILVCNPAEYEDETEEEYEQPVHQPKSRDQAYRQTGPQQGYYGHSGQTRGKNGVQLTRGQAVY